MIWFLRGLFIVVLGTMLWVTGWASLQQPLGDFARGPVIRDPWVVATLADAYWAFLAFFVWVAWKEQSFGARLLWFLSLVALGNLAIALYMLRELGTVPAAGPQEDALARVFTRRNPGHLALPGGLVAVSVGLYLLA